MPNYWSIVNRIIDKSDILLEILDARLIDETRNAEIEQKVAQRGKRLIYVINKCDLVDKRYLDRKKRELQPSVFISSTQHLGTTMLRTRILELARKEAVVVGVLGYPNTGKSSVINALAGRSKARTSPQSGFTRGVQKIRVDRRITLLDSPGVIPFRENDEFKHAVIGARNPSEVRDIELVAMRLIEHLGGTIESHYGVEKSEDVDETLASIARKHHKLRRGGEPDTALMARIILQDWQKGRITLRRA